MERGVLSGAVAPVAAFHVRATGHGACLLVGGVPDIILDSRNIIAGTPHTDDHDQGRKEQFLEHSPQKYRDHC